MKARMIRVFAASIAAALTITAAAPVFAAEGARTVEAFAVYFDVTEEDMVWQQSGEVVGQEVPEDDVDVVWVPILWDEEEPEEEPELSAEEKRAQAIEFLKRFYWNLNPDDVNDVTAKLERARKDYDDCKANLCFCTDPTVKAMTQAMLYDYADQIYYLEILLETM